MKKRLKKRNAALLFIAILAAFGSIVFLNQNYQTIKKKDKEVLSENKEEKLLKEIQGAYHEFVKTNKDANLYLKNENTYDLVGKIKSGTELSLEDMQIDENTQYFLITDLNYYVHYQDVEPIEHLQSIDTHYQNYLVFNEDVVTKENAGLYDGDEVVLELIKSHELPIFIKDDAGYYVQYWNRLFYIKKEDVEEIRAVNHTSEVPRENIRTLTYHTVYDPDRDNCTNVDICHPIDQFDSHMKYLSENGYFTLTMSDLELFLQGKIQLPQKSIVITLDDGSCAHNAVRIVEKYQVHATYFIITSSYDVSSIETEYMAFESHSHALHQNWKCSGGNQGGLILCADRDVILEDLKTSQEKLNGSFAFAYPFFDYNYRAMEILKEAGFRLAFIGQADTNGYSTRKTNPLLLRRKTIFAQDSLEKFISYLT